MRTWPKLTVGRLKVGDQTPEIHRGAVEHGPAWEHETYVPQSSPNVLTPDEAREAAVGLMTAVGFTDDAAMERLADRLSVFADSDQSSGSGEEQ